MTTMAMTPTPESTRGMNVANTSNVQTNVAFNTSSSQRLKFHMSKTMKKYLKTHWIMANSGRKLMAFLNQLASFAGFVGDVHLFFNKTPKNKKDVEIIFTSEEGKDAVLKFYNNITDNSEVVCYIPEFGDNYNKNFALIQDGVITFFEMDLERTLLVPMFAKQYYSEESAIIASRCVQLAGASRCAMVTFELEKYTAYVVYTMLIPNRKTHMDLMDSFSNVLVNELNRINSNDNVTAYDYYAKTKKLLEEICSSFIVEIYENKDCYLDKDKKLGACKNKLVVKDNTVYSFMRFDAIKKRAVTVFGTQDWVCQTEFQEVYKKGEIIHQSEIAVDNISVSKVPSLQEIREYVPKFILEKLWSAFEE